MKQTAFEEDKAVTVTEQQISKLKKTELEMLKVFISICEKNGLQYYAVGGTTLGAVRHKGFIPWDDDIDVAMPRSDYEKFMKTAQLQLPDSLFLQNAYTDSEYPMNFAKIRNSNTTFVERSCKNFKINHGVYLDIFPLDGYPTSKTKALALEFFKKMYNTRISLEYYTEDNSSFIKKSLKRFLRVLYPDYKRVVEKREKLFKKYAFDLCDYTVNHCGAWEKREIMPKEYFGKGVSGQFEDIEVILPERTDEYLTCLYGNYMELPPKEKQIPHHYVAAIDLEKAYTEYIQEKFR